MFDGPDDTHSGLSHNLPCPECGHELHPFLPCSDVCACAHHR